MSKAKQARAAVYVRISRDSEGLGLGVARQEKDCRRLAADKGWDVVDVFADNDISASRGSKVRPEYRRMLTAIEAGHVEVVLVYNLDRLTRRPIELEEFVALADRTGVRLTIVTGGGDISRDDGLLLARIQAAVAADEASKIGRRVKRKQQELREQGKPYVGGKRPYGYDSTRMVVQKDEAQVLRRIAKKVLAGASLGSIVADLDAKGVPTVYGGPWQRRTVKDMMLNARYWGLTPDLRPAAWPAILDNDKHPRDVVQAMLTHPDRYKNAHDNRRRNLLTGVLVCGVCDGPTDAVTDSRGHKRYRCRVKFCTTIKRDDLDAYVLDKVARRVPVQRRTKVRDPQIDRLRQELDEARKQQEATALSHSRGELSLRAFSIADQGFTARITDIEKRLSGLVVDDLVEDLPTDLLIENLDALDLDGRRRLVMAYVERLAVLSGKGRSGRAFDPSRVVLELRGEEVVTDDDVDDNTADPWTTVRRRRTDEKPKKKVRPPAGGTGSGSPTRRASNRGSRRPSS